jgi:hypothetical protein
MSIYRNRRINGLFEPFIFLKTGHTIFQVLGIVVKQ